MNMDNIPVIDIRRLGDAETLSALHSACRDWGFFQVINHGIATDVLEDLQQKMQAFFTMSREAKQRIARTADNPWGYFDQELTKNTLDLKQVFDYGPAEIPADGREPRLIPQWPQSVPGFKPAVLAYYQACERLALDLLDTIAINLGVADGALRQHFQPHHTSFVRLNYYPVCPDPTPGGLGVNHHTDAGAVTVLHQADEPGLEVFRDGDWHLIDVRPDALVINIGDIVQVWSNDGYRAPLHRVRASAAKARYSAPFFLNPAYESDYAPLPTTVDAANPQRYRTINWGQFRRQRATGDYLDQGEEIQISHYLNPASEPCA